MKPVSNTGGEKLAFDPKQLDKLKQLGDKNASPETVKNASKQFEALFLGMVLKTMREASQSTTQNELTGSDQQKTLNEFLDQQLAQKVASKGKGVGLANMIAKQIDKMNNPTNLGKTPDGNDPVSALAGTMALIQSQPKISKNKPINPYAGLASLNKNPNVSSNEFTKNAGDFVNKMWNHASNVASSLGVPAHFLVAQAALETGWGKRQLVGVDGRNSHNLFGIKADSKWKGDYVEATTTEWFGGTSHKMVQRFRSYASYEDSFRDYANFLKVNPRYKGLFNNGVLDEQAFASTLQRSGYATDPGYANKLVKIMQSSTMRNALTSSPTQPTTSVNNANSIQQPVAPKNPELPNVNNVNVKPKRSDQATLLNSQSIINTLNSVYNKID